MTAPREDNMATNGLSERLQTPISTAELQRRWAAVRAAVDAEITRVVAATESFGKP